MYKLFLVNHTQYEYTQLCRSNFSQERTLFLLPADWQGDSDDMEVMTEFVFREKLKHRHKYNEVDMLPDMDSDEEEKNSDQEDLKDEYRKKYTSESSGRKEKKEKGEKVEKDNEECEEECEDEEDEEEVIDEDIDT